MIPQSVQDEGVLISISEVVGGYTILVCKPYKPLATLTVTF